MPEGPEVRRIGNVVAEAIGGLIETLHPVDNPKYKFARDGIPGIELLEAKSEWAITDVKVKGKLIRIDLSSAGDQISILNTLGMSGNWLWDTHDHKHARVHILFLYTVQRENPQTPLPPGTIGRILTFVDQRSFGTIRVVSRADGEKAFNKIGWDLLQEPMEEKDWQKLQTKLGSKKLGVALMEQKHFSGIGNIYKAEILYRLKFHPEILIKDLSEDNWMKINRTAHAILRRSYKLGGSSIRNYNYGVRQGTYQHILKIYNKKQCPKGHNTEKLRQNKRSTWYCPTCQS